MLISMKVILVLHQVARLIDHNISNIKYSILSYFYSKTMH